MNIAKSIHETAMEFCVRAEAAKAKEKPEQAVDWQFLAYILEKKALEKVGKNDTLRRHLIIQSAAALAYKVGSFEEGIRLAKLGISENPNGHIKSRLEEIIRLINIAKKTENLTKIININGILSDVNTKENQISLTNEEANQVFSILTPPALFKKIIRQYYTKKVNIKAKMNEYGTILLEEIKIAA